MDRKTRHTVTLSPDEFTEAVRKYINLHTVGEVPPADSISVFMVTKDHGRHADVSVEAQWFE